MNICFVRTNFNLLTGATRATFNLAGELIAMGYRVTLVSIYSETECPPDELPAGAEYCVLKVGSTRLREGLVDAVVRLRRMAAGGGFSWVLSVGISPSVVVIPALVGLRDVRSVLVEHSNRKNVMGADKNHDRLYKLAVPHFDKVVVLTKEDKREYLSRYRIEEHDVQIIPNWVSCDVLAAASPCDCSSKRIISVGRLAPEKGYDKLLEVASMVLPSRPDWFWDIYGDGESEDNVRSLISDLNLVGRVNLMGSVPDVIHRYAAYSIFVMTSYFEGLPLALLEAKANALPAVAFSCPTGPSEIIEDGLDGFLVPCYDSACMAERLSFLMDDVEARERFSSRSVACLERYSKDSILSSWIALLNQA